MVIYSLPPRSCAGSPSRMDTRSRSHQFLLARAGSREPRYSTLGGRSSDRRRWGRRRLLIQVLARRCVVEGKERKDELLCMIYANAMLVMGTPFFFAMRSRTTETEPSLPVAIAGILRPSFFSPSSGDLKRPPPRAPQGQSDMPSLLHMGMICNHPRCQRRIHSQVHYPWDLKAAQFSLM